MVSKRLHEPWQAMLVALEQELKGDRSEHDVLTSEPPDPYHLFLLPKDVRSLMVEDR